MTARNELVTWLDWIRTRDPVDSRFPMWLVRNPKFQSILTPVHSVVPSRSVVSSMVTLHKREQTREDVGGEMTNGHEEASTHAAGIGGPMKDASTSTPGNEWRDQRGGRKEARGRRVLATIPYRQRTYSKVESVNRFVQNYCTSRVHMRA